MIPDGRERGLPAAPVIALDEVADGGPRLRPLGLVAEDLDIAAPPGELGHRGDDRIVVGGARPTRVDDAGHEVAADEVEGGPPAADPDAVALAERLQPVVVADRSAIVLVDVARQRDAARGRLG